jgi:DNA-binding MarR family transcriptional regulator
MRLERKRYAESLFLRKIWWPIFRSFDDLHPEYEVLDWRGKSYFVDFIWTPGTVMLAFEVKGYGPHVTEMDRRGYCEELNRETFLQGLGYRVISIPHDDVVSRPEVIIALLRLVLGRYQTIHSPMPRLSLIEIEILRLGCKLAGPLRGVDAARHLKVSRRTAVRYLNRLCACGVMEALRTGATEERVTAYRIRDEGFQLLEML